MDERYEGLAEKAGVAPGLVRRVRTSRLDTLSEEDVLAEETPVALEYNGIAYATMLATQISGCRPMCPVPTRSSSASCPRTTDSA